MKAHASDKAIAIVGAALLTLWAGFGLYARLAPYDGNGKINLAVVHHLCNVYWAVAAAAGGSAACSHVGLLYTFATVAFWAGIMLFSYGFVKIVARR